MPVWARAVLRMECALHVQLVTSKEVIMPVWVTACRVTIILQPAISSGSKILERLDAESRFQRPMLLNEFISIDERSSLGGSRVPTARIARCRC